MLNHTIFSLIVFPLQRIPKMFTTCSIPPFILKARAAAFRMCPSSSVILCLILVMEANSLITGLNDDGYMSVRHSDDPQGRV